MKILWEELKSLRPIPSCIYDIHCTCSLMMVKYKESKHIMCFLKGLNYVYNTINTHIVFMESLSSVNNIFSLIL